jgi:hypothetical protein
MADLPEHRKAMDAAIKATLAPILRANGFKGSFPNWRRTLEGRIDLLGIQHLSSGGTFFLNIGQLPADGFRTGWKAAIPVAKLHLGHAGRRDRVQPDPATDGWTFCPRSYEPQVPLHPAAHYTEIAEALARRFQTFGLDWFSVSVDLQVPPDQG